MKIRALILAGALLAGGTLRVTAQPPLSPAAALAGKSTHVAFVIDTSGSMLSPKTREPWPVVFALIDEILAAVPEAKFIQALHCDGRPLIGARGKWLARTPEVEAQLLVKLRRDNSGATSNPIPGVYVALRDVQARADAGERVHVFVIGDEFVSSMAMEAVLRRLDELNPADAKGRRTASISASQLPTTARNPGGTMATTGVMFQMLMSEVTKRHGGTYRMLPNLDRL